MKQLEKILMATDLSETSRRGLIYACSLAAENKATLLVLYVANGLEAWEQFSEDSFFAALSRNSWPTDRVLSEAALDLTHFLEPHLELMKAIPLVTKRVLLGPIAQRIASAAEEEKVDLIVMSPRRSRGIRRLLMGGTTERVTRLSSCPVLSVTAPRPSRPWRGRLGPAFSGWPRQKVASI